MLNNTRPITISISPSRLTKRLTRKQLDLYEFYESLRVPSKSNESFAEYLRLPPAEQLGKKDVGAFMAGVYTGDVRSQSAVTSREIITLDIDNTLGHNVQNVIDRLNNIRVGWCIYSTRKHSPRAPRLRVLIPLHRACTPEEYEALARKVADLIYPGMEIFDKTTFQPSRLMFYPSVSCDGEYIFEYADKPLLNVDASLESAYHDWHNIREWPLCPDEKDIHLSYGKKAEDPTAKQNLVGAFCRAYNIHSAIEHFLPDKYEPVSNTDDRYTYLAGSTAAGAVVYGDGDFIYSHHSTDPAGGVLCNAFDLVRLHFYSSSDDNAKEDTPISKLPSFAKMRELCTSDELVLAEWDAIRYKATAQEVFGVAPAWDNPFSVKPNADPDYKNPFDPPAQKAVVNDPDYKNPFDPPDDDYKNPFDPPAEAPDVPDNPFMAPEPTQGIPTPFDGPQEQEEPVADRAWKKKLKRNPTNGQIECTINNMIIIMENDPKLKGKIRYNEFSYYGVECQGALPWNPSDKRRQWSDTDDSGMRWYVEAEYGIANLQKVQDGINLVAQAKSYDPLKDFIRAEKWDGVPRLDTVFIDFLGAEDNEYNRQVARKSHVAAVARALNPGTKFDIMTVLNGPQGMGKSTYLRKISGGWFNDGMQSFNGKDAAEVIQASWIIEIGELVAMSKSETNRIKQFLSQNEDIYRRAYGRRVNEHPRRCVFFGTTNSYDYLKDPTGSRRFWPVDVFLNGKSTNKSVFTDLDAIVPQLWAEAYHYYKKGENIMVFAEERLERMAEEMREARREESPKAGAIAAFVAQPVPLNWSRKSLQERKLYWLTEPGARPNEPLVPRDRICAAEIWCEMYNEASLKNLTPRESREINDILATLPQFKHMGGKAKQMRFGGAYGVQRGFEVKVDEDKVNPYD